MQVLEEGTPWANCAELYIGLFKDSTRRYMCIANSTKALWDYCLEQRGNIHNAIPPPLFQNNGAKLMYQHLVNKETFPISVILDGINGFTIVPPVLILKLRSVLVVFWDLRRMKAMKCHNMS